MQRNVAKETDSPQGRDGQAAKEPFSPLSLKSTPGLVKQGNLTGSPRKLKDGAADLHNLVVKWNTLQIDGTNIVNEIANIKLERLLCQSDESEDHSSADLLPPSLLPLCDKLTQLLKRMEKVVYRLSGLVSMCHGVEQLECRNQTTEKSVILFQGWDLKQFEDTIREVTQMYRKELELKKSIAENICHAKDRNSVMFYVASWVHQPYIEDRSKLQIESILLETKLK